MEPAFVWTGTEMIVFGGIKFTDGLLSFGDGARYDPATDFWTPFRRRRPRSRTGLTAV
jgi:N-acetylneuraminic acid mutarotase